MGAPHIKLKSKRKKSHTRTWSKTKIKTIPKGHKNQNENLYNLREALATYLFPMFLGW